MPAPSRPAAPLLDKRLARRAFARAAPGYDRCARVEQEVGARLLDHLDPVRIHPARVLDAGSGTGALARELARRYRGALVIELDLAEPMLRVARRKARRWFSRQRFVCADAERLPLTGHSMDLVFSNLLLQWCDDPVPVFEEFRRVLAPGGLLEFSTFGPDTLMELRESWAAVDPAVHVHAFADMHDVGDALVRSGFVDAVMDCERLTVEYPDVDALLGDLRGAGARNVSAGRRAGLTGRGRLAGMRSAYEAMRRDGTIPATFEIVYGHAWAPARAAVEVPLTELRPRG